MLLVLLVPLNIGIEFLRYIEAIAIYYILYI